jgi:glutathione S-transferase
MKLDVWGLEASPYLLKVEALLRFRQIPFRRLPRDGGRWENIRTARALGRARRERKVLRYPVMGPLDEYPSVPYLIVDGNQFHYDSSSIAHWLDEQSPPGALPFVPGDPALAFLCRLIDEAFDEYGLYMVHHQRWVCSATDTAMGEVTAQELGRLSPWPITSFIRVKLPRRQVRRCPYLFSVAPEGFQAPVEALRVPPSREGFPPTHALLEQSWRQYLEAMESLLAVQPYILGERFTLADGSAYGQLAMNLIDPTTARTLEDIAPRTYQWLLSIRDGQHHGSSGELFLSPALKPLLEIIMTSFVPLMVQNERAYDNAREQGEELFNEAAFDKHRALYDGELLGHPFRAVAKTFQVKVWRDLCAVWQGLNEHSRATLGDYLPAATLFDGQHKV